MKLLVVLKDDPAVLNSIHLELRRAGYAVVEADSVASAWKSALEEDRIEAAIVGIELPVVFGWELLNRMRSDTRYARTPTLMVAESFDEAEKQKADDLHCGYVAKPIAPVDLVTKLNILIKHAMITETRTVRVVLLTDTCEVEGSIHIPPGLSRFSDAWEAVFGDNRSFVPVTDARVTTLDGGRVVAHAAFMEITKAQLRGVFPTEGARRPDPAHGLVGGAVPKAVDELTKVALDLMQQLAEDKGLPVESVLQQLVSGLAESMPGGPTPRPPSG